MGRETEGSENPLITIVVPIYNVERFLRPCIESILGQTYKNLEIILVDDGSTDSCGKICDKYEKIDSRILVIHQENKGLSEARNAGIDAATGEYIAFIDSDDYVRGNYTETLLHALVENDAEIAVCSFQYVDEEGKYIRNSSRLKEKKKTYTGEQFLMADRQLQDVSIIAWNKLYKRSVFSKLRYRAGVLYEDAFIYPELFWNCRKVVVINESLYFYRERRGSIVHSPLTMKRAKMHYDFYKEWKCFFAEKKNRYLYDRAVQGCSRSISDLYSSDVTKKEIQKDLHKKLQKEMRENVRILLWSRNITLKDRIHNFVSFIDLRLTGSIKKYKRIMKHGC